jgi:Fic family protein
MYLPHSSFRKWQNTSEIEGELLNYDQVRSSIARRLGIHTAGLVASNRHIEGVVEMMLDATQRYTLPLIEKRLFGWHAALFPTGYSGPYAIETGRYRTGEIQVVSGAMGKEKATLPNGSTGFCIALKMRCSPLKTPHKKY